MFKLDIVKRKNDISAIRTIKQDGIEMTLEIKKDAEFETAVGNMGQFIEDKPKLTREVLKRGQDSINVNEAMIYIIGEYLITDWNIEVEGNKLDINGDNLFLVLENAFDDKPHNFIKLLLDTFSELTKEYNDKLLAVKKKLLNTTTTKNKSEQ